MEEEILNEGGKIFGVNQYIKDRLTNRWIYILHPNRIDEYNRDTEKRRSLQKEEFETIMFDLFCIGKDDLNG